MTYVTHETRSLASAQPVISMNDFFASCRKGRMSMRMSVTKKLISGAYLRSSQQEMAQEYISLMQFAALTSAQSLARAGGQRVWLDTNLNKYLKTFYWFVPEMQYVGVWGTFLGSAGFSCAILSCIWRLSLPSSGASLQIEICQSRFHSEKRNWVSSVPHFFCQKVLPIFTWDKNKFFSIIESRMCESFGGQRRSRKALVNLLCI